MNLVPALVLAILVPWVALVLAGLLAVAARATVEVRLGGGKEGRIGPSGTQLSIENPPWLAELLWLGRQQMVKLGEQAIRLHEMEAEIGRMRAPAPHPPPFTIQLPSDSDERTEGEP